MKMYNPEEEIIFDYDEDKDDDIIDKQEFYCALVK